MTGRPSTPTRIRFPKAGSRPRPRRRQRGGIKPWVSMCSTGTTPAPRATLPERSWSLRCRSSATPARRATGMRRSERAPRVRRRRSPEQPDGSVNAELEHDFVDVTPVPVFAGLHRANDWVPGRVEVRSGVSVRAVVAAPDHTAFGTAPQVHPLGAEGDAGRTPRDARSVLAMVDRVQVRAGFGHGGPPRN